MGQTQMHEQGGESYVWKLPGWFYQQWREGLHKICSEEKMQLRIRTSRNDGWTRKPKCLADILKFGASCKHDYFTYIARGHHGSIGHCGCRKAGSGAMQVVSSRPAGVSDIYKFKGDCPIQ